MPNETCLKRLSVLRESIDGELVELNDGKRPQHVQFIQHVREKITDIALCEMLSVLTSSEHGVYTSAIQALCGLIHELMEFKRQHKDAPEINIVVYAIETLNSITTSLFLENQLL